MIWLGVGLLLAQQQQPEPGKLFLVGGGSTPDEVCRRFVEASGGSKAVIVAMAQVRLDPDSGSKASVEFIRENGAGKVFAIPEASFTNKDLENLEERLRSVTGVWIPGGDQELFMDRFGAWWLHRNFRPMLARGVNFYGTSAGAMIMSNPMIAGPGEKPRTAKMRSGIGLTTWTIDTHFRQRNRQERLLDALRQSPSKQGLGLSESGWVIIQGDKILESHGSVDVVAEPTAGTLPLR